MAEVTMIPLEALIASPHNPRNKYGPIEELADSLNTHGLLQAIVVRPFDADHWEIIAGHRRFAAAQTLGWPEIACVVRDAQPDEAFVLTLVENLQRDDLSPREEASALEMLLRERGWDTYQVADAIKRSQSFVSKRLRVFDDPHIAPYVLRNELSVSVAEELLILGRDDREPMVQRALAEQWSRRDARVHATAVVQPWIGRRPRGLTSKIESLRRDLERMQPADFTAADRRSLLKLFKVGQWSARREAITGPPIIPMISDSGQVSIEDGVAAEVS